MFMTGLSNVFKTFVYSVRINQVALLSANIDHECHKECHFCSWHGHDFIRFILSYKNFIRFHPISSFHTKISSNFIRMKFLYEDEEKFHPDEIVSMPGFCFHNIIIYAKIYYIFLCILFLNQKCPKLGTFAQN